MNIKPKSAFQAWYKKHGEELNKRRKNRYKNDPKYREKAKELSKQYRLKKARRGNIKILNGKKVEVRRIGYVSKVAKRSVYVLNYWESKGRIPKPTIGGKHRYYTQKQVDLIVEFSDTVNRVQKESVRVQREVLKAKSAEINSKWEN